VRETKFLHGRIRTDMTESARPGAVN
jgi:hypothetical protein